MAVNQETTVGQTIEVLRDLPDDHPTVHYVYALDEYDKLVGVLSLRTLVLAPDSTPISEIMYDEIISVPPSEEEDDVAADIFKYDIPAMPVVDEHGELLGIVTVDDAWDAIEEDVSSEKMRMSALKILSIGLAAILFLILYTLIVLQISGVIGN